MLNIIKSEIISEAGAIQATSSKLLGNMAFMAQRNHDGKAPQNMNIFFQSLGLGSLNNVTLYLLDATHSGNTAIITSQKEKGRIILKQQNQAVLILKLTAFNAQLKASIQDDHLKQLIARMEQGLDATICHQSNVFLGLLHADCAPVCLYDPLSQFYALVHAGTIGVLQGIVIKTINLMIKECGIQPRNILAYIGPCIADKNYNITHSVYWPIIEKLMTKQEAKKLDLKQRIKSQLLQAGVQSTKIEISPYCTVESPLFFSNHSAKEPVSEGRNLTLIGLKRRKDD